MEVMKESPALETLRAENRQLIHNLQTADELEAKLKVLEAMGNSPALETLRAEKNTQIHDLQSADKLEAEVKRRDIQRLRDPTLAVEEAAPAEPAAGKVKQEAESAGLKLWWQRKWR